MPLRWDMRNSTGGVMAAPLCVASPGPCWRDDECIPAPAVMSPEILDPARNVKQVVVERDVIRRSGDGLQPLAHPRRRRPHAAHRRVNGRGREPARRPGGLRTGSPADRRGGLTRPSAVARLLRCPQGRQWRLAPPGTEPEPSSPHAALHLGPINVVLETAAMQEAALRTGTDALQIESWTVMMVRPGLVGPFRAATEVLSDRSGWVPVQLALHDEGRGDRVISRRSRFPAPSTPDAAAQREGSTRILTCWSGWCSNSSSPRSTNASTGMSSLIMAPASTASVASIRNATGKSTAGS